MFKTIIDCLNDVFYNISEGTLTDNLYSVFENNLFEFLKDTKDPSDTLKNIFLYKYKPNQKAKKGIARIYKDVIPNRVEQKIFDLINGDGCDAIKIKYISCLPLKGQAEELGINIRYLDVKKPKGITSDKFYLHHFCDDGKGFFGGEGQFLNGFIDVCVAKAMTYFIDTPINKEVFEWSSGSYFMSYIKFPDLLHDFELRSIKNFDSYYDSKEKVAGLFKGLFEKALIEINKEDFESTLTMIIKENDEDQCCLYNPRDTLRMFKAMGFERVLEVCRIIFEHNFVFHGWPDITIYRNSKISFQEVKAAKDKLRESQVYFYLDKIEREGAIFEGCTYEIIKMD